MQDLFTLAQEFVLLASDSETHKWRKPMNSYLQTYAAGAVLIELLSEKVIRVGDKGKLEIITDNKDKYSGDEAARIMLHKMERSRTKTMKKWMQFMYSWRKERSQVFQAVLKPLIRNGDLQEESYRVLMLFPTSRYKSSAVSKDRIIQRIRAELLEEGPVTQKTALLTMMLEVGKLLKGYFSEYEQNELKIRLQSLQAEQGDQWQAISQIRKAIVEMNAVMAAAAT